MAGKIFINYRRDDDPGFTQALYQRLEDEFTAADLFMDVEGQIKPGDDFVDVLNDQVAATDVLLVVIGPRWVGLLAARASDPDDFVVIEIRAALEKRKVVIPVLVGGASMPNADTLPEAIRRLARIQAIGLRPERFKADCQGIVTRLKECFAKAEERAKEQLDMAEMERVANKAEEEWPAVRDSGDPGLLRFFEQRFGGTRYEDWAREVRKATEARMRQADAPERLAKDAEATGQKSERDSRPLVMQQGTISRLTDRGYGFIKPDDGEKALFFHSKDLQHTRYDDLREGEKVIFDIVESPRGPYAIRVKRG